MSPQGLFLPSFEQFKSILYPSITIDISKTMKGFKAMESFFDYKYYRAKIVSLKETILGKNASIFLEMFVLLQNDSKSIAKQPVKYQ